MKIKDKLLLCGMTAGAVLVGGTAASADELDYNVQAGDTLSHIALNTLGDASRYQEIADQNGIADANVIHVGQTLKINTDGVATQTQQPVEEETYQEETYQEETYQELEYIEPAAEQFYQETAYQGSSSDAKEWIAQRESSGSYSASNGYHIGRYQCAPGHFDTYAPGEDPWDPNVQEKVADAYVSDRYGSWEAAQAFWQANGWY